MLEASVPDLPAGGQAQNSRPPKGFDTPLDLPPIEDRAGLLALARPWFPGVLRVFPYHDQAGKVVYLHVRVDAGDHPSKFRWATVNHDGSLTPGKSAPDVLVEPLYGYARAKQRGTDLIIWVCEGEKDCDALWAAGYVAVCSPDGASKPGQRIKWRDLYTEALAQLEPATVIVVADPDKPGFWTAESLAQTLEQGLPEVLVYRAHPETGDAADHLDGGISVSDFAFVPRYPTSGDPQAHLSNGHKARKDDDYMEVDDGHGRRIKRAEYNDSGYAEYFADHYGDKARFDHRRKLWLVYKQHHWEPDEDGQVDRWFKEMMHDRIRNVPASHDDQLIKHAYKWLSRDKRSAVRDLARSEPPIADAGRDWNQHNGLLAVGNGVVDLRTGLRQPGRPEDKFSLWTPVEYYGLETPASRWERFLKEVFGGDGEVIDYAQRYLGYCITGETSEQLLALCRGTQGGANGKGKLFMALRRTLGWYVHTLPFSALATVGSERGKAWSIADLPGKRLVLSSETQEGAWFNTDRVKALTGQDELNVERKHEHPFTFVPVAKYLLAVNTLPHVPSDKAFWRRVRVFPFDQQFNQHSPEAQRLDAELVAELPGILAWLARGARAWYQDGLEPTPRAVDLATKQYEHDQDPLAEYFAQRLERTPENVREEYWVRKSALRADYEQYCRAHAVKPIDGWVKALEDRGLKGTTVVDKENGRTVAVWRGVRFKQ